MDVAREEYVSDVKAMMRVIEEQQTAIRCLLNAVNIKDEVVAEKERKAAYLAMDRAESAIDSLDKRIVLTEALVDFDDDDWEILLDKLRGMVEPEEEEE
jgi:hypothetical protein